MRTGIVLCLYFISYNLYLFSMATVPMHESTTRLWNYYNIGGLLLYTFIREYFLVTPLELELLSVCKLTVIITIFMIILHYHKIIQNIYWFTGWFDFSMLLTTLMIVVSGKRHGFFKHE